MILRIIATFILFAALAYYFNIDVRKIVDESGFPDWLRARGIPTQHDSGTSTPLEHIKE